MSPYSRASPSMKLSGSRRLASTSRPKKGFPFGPGGRASRARASSSTRASSRGRAGETFSVDKGLCPLGLFRVERERASCIRLMLAALLYAAHDLRDELARHEAHCARDERVARARYDNRLPREQPAV